MMQCDEAQVRLLDHGTDLNKHEASIQTHIKSCSACQSFLENLRRVDLNLMELPSFSASNTLIEQTISRVSQPSPSATKKDKRPLIAAALAASLFLSGGLTLFLHFTEMPRSDVTVAQLDRENQQKNLILFGKSRAENAAVDLDSRENRLVSKAKEQTLSEWDVISPQPKAINKPQFPLERNFKPLKNETIIDGERKWKKDKLAPLKAEMNTGLSSLQFSIEDTKKDKRKALNTSAANTSEFIAETIDLRNHFADTPELPIKQRQTANKIKENKSSVLEQNRQQIAASGKLKKILIRTGEEHHDDALTTGRSATINKTEPIATADASSATAAAKKFIAANASLGKLSFKTATGYWANTYLPGDTSIRQLEARLRQWDRSTLLGQQPSLEQRIKPHLQPFDPPQNAAMAVYIDAEQSTIEEPTRMRLQIGLQATNRHSGHRPTMNVAVIIDLSEKNRHAWKNEVNALMKGIVAAQQAGDHISVLSTSTAESLMIAAPHFRHGSVAVAMQQLFDPQNKPARYHDLESVMDQANTIIQHDDDPTATLGSSTILLISDHNEAIQYQSLEHQVQQNAVNGITFSAFPLGTALDAATLDNLILLGQGQRRVLSAPEQAEKLTAETFYAASRAVARALRLNIHLHQQVKLIDVIGSYRLDDFQAQRVRHAEQSIDQRLSRNLAIAADRGEDEAGIQIVIPSFFAGDTHIILLDVLVENPGTVADVSLSYKDLLYLRNGLARANLNVASGLARSTPLTQTILKNRLAQEIADVSRRAGTLLSTGKVESARQLIQQLHLLLRGMALQQGTAHNDPELLVDIQIFENYLKLLDVNPHDPVLRQHLSDSLQLSAYRKLGIGNKQ